MSETKHPNQKPADPTLLVPEDERESDIHQLVVAETLAEGTKSHEDPNDQSVDVDDRKSNPPGRLPGSGASTQKSVRTMPVNSKEKPTEAGHSSGRLTTTAIMFALVVFGFKRLEYSLPWGDHVLLSIAINIVLLAVIWTRWNSLGLLFKRKKLDQLNAFTMVLQALAFYASATIIFIILKFLIPVIGNGDAMIWIGNLLFIAWLTTCLRWYLENGVSDLRKNQLRSVWSKISSRKHRSGR